MNASYFQFHVGKPRALPSCGKLASCVSCQPRYLVPLRFISNLLLACSLFLKFSLGPWSLPFSANLPSHLFLPHRQCLAESTSITVWTPGGLYKLHQVGCILLRKRCEGRHIVPQCSRGPECTHQQKQTNNSEIICLSIIYEEWGNAEMGP